MLVRFYRKRLTKLILAVVFLFSILLIFKLKKTCLEQQRFFISSNIRFLHLQSLFLPDVMDSKHEPEQESIFFIESNYNKQLLTSITLFDYIFKKLFWDEVQIANLTFRQACAVESAALLHPEKSIYVLYITPVYLFEENMPEAIRTLLIYPNIQLRHINPWTITRGTPYEDWFLRGQIFESDYSTEMLEIFLKFLVLWHWGGTCLDFDVVLLKSLSELEWDFVGAESEAYASTAVMNFFDRNIIEKFLQQFILNFSTHERETYGSKLLTNVLKEVCKVDRFIEMYVPYTCPYIKVLLPFVFYADDYKNEVEMISDSDYTYELNESFNNSYFFLYFRAAIMNSSIEAGTAGYGLIAATNCPKVYNL